MALGKINKTSTNRGYRNMCWITDLNDGKASSRGRRIQSRDNRSQSSRQLVEEMAGHKYRHRHRWRAGFYLSSTSTCATVVVNRSRRARARVWRVCPMVEVATGGGLERLDGDHRRHRLPDGNRRHRLPDGNCRTHLRSAPNQNLARSLHAAHSRPARAPASHRSNVTLAT